MVCVYCSGDTRVVNSRHQVKDNRVWRRRQCRLCHAVSTTQEMLKYELVWMVNSNNAFQPFSRDKLFISLYKCCEHRKAALSDAAALTNTIINKLAAQTHEFHNSSSTLSSTLINRDIARITLVALNRFDKVSAVRYRSLHQYL